MVSIIKIDVEKTNKSLHSTSAWSAYHDFIPKTENNCGDNLAF
jgi:hypothetical protein